MRHRIMVIGFGLLLASLLAGATAASAGMRTVLIEQGTSAT